MKSLIILILFYSTTLFAQSASEYVRITSSNSNFYEVLNISPDANPAEIKRAYRKLMSTYHPDRYMDNTQKFDVANKAMKRLNDAYEVLGDALKRKSYDITVKATSAMKAPTSEASAKAWQKHNFTDFTAKEKPAEKAKAQPRPEAKPEPKAEPKAEAKANASPEPSKTNVASTSSSTEVRTSEKGPTSYMAKKAQKMYVENSRCAVRYFQNIIDESL
jgi:DnaJ-class molecular chaperone